MEITCPIPDTSTDVITLGHGSGGLLTHQLLRDNIFHLLQNEWMDQQHDGAIFHLEGPLAFSTDSYVVTPLFFPGGNIGDLAVNGTVNDLAMCGARARYLSLSLIAEEGLRLEELKAVLTSIRDAAMQAGVQIVTGDTKVVEKGKGDKLFINTSGIGLLHPKADIRHQRISAGDKLILSGQLARHGIAIMSQRKGLEFSTTIGSDTRPLHHIVMKLLDQFGNDIKFLRDPTRGGLASVLNEIAGLTPYGYWLQQDALPLHPEVEGACEMLGLDPLYIANEGIFLAVVSADAANNLLEILQQLPGGEDAAIIGEVTEAHPGKVVLQSGLGGLRVVSFLPGELLPRIC